MTEPLHRISTNAMSESYEEYLEALYTEEVNSKIIETMFKDDTREKARTARGIHNRALRARAHECVRMPSDNLNKFDRRRILSPGPLRITNFKEEEKMNLFERIAKGDIPTQAEIEALGDFTKIQEVLAELLRLHNKPEIGKVWKMKPKALTFYTLGKYKIFKIGRGVLIGDEAVKASEVKTAVNVKRGLRDREAKKIKALDQHFLPEPIAEPIEPKEQTIITINKIMTFEELVGLFERLSMFGTTGQLYELNLTMKEQKS